jgi:hypothetical protein
MEKKVYQVLAYSFVAWQNCVKSGNKEWEDKHEETIKGIIDSLPHGSGIDGTTSFDFDESREEKLVINSSYHSMNDDGYYDGWTDIKLVITPSLAFGFNLKVTGSFPRRYSDTKDYLHETFSYALSEEVKD